MIEISEILTALAKKRPIFHSEADFQHAFGWEINQILPNALVRLELPIQVKNQFLHIDIWIVNQGEVVAVELKYKTRGLSMQIDNEHFGLKNQSAQDIGRYDFIKDIHRLEQIGDEQRNFIGYAILLTNDSSYWIKPASQNTVDADFRLYNGRTLEGGLDWGTNASDGTKRDREQPISLQKKYFVKWQNYSRPALTSYGEFRSLTIRVAKDQKVD